LSTIAVPTIAGAVAFGSAIGPDDTLWVAQLSGGVSRFTRGGEFLGHFNPGFSVPDIGVDPVDGTLWISSPDGMLHHFDPDGVQLGSFSTEATPPFINGVAVSLDHTIYVSSSQTSDPAFMLHYNASGQLLDKFPVPRDLLFISVQNVPEPSTAALLAIGCVASLAVVRRIRQR
jgi:outer membrane protein assembly factor BamB